MTKELKKGMKTMLYHIVKNVNKEIEIIKKKST